MRLLDGFGCVPVLSFLLLAAQAPALRADELAPLGKKITNITLQGLDGKALPLHDLKGQQAVVVVFLSFECPISTSYLPDISALAKKHEDKQVRLLGVCPTTEKAEVLAQQARQYDLTFPLFRDEDGRVARHFRATSVPEACVLDGQFVLRYQGRIDDSYFARLKKKIQPPRRDLELALTEILAGKSVSVPCTKAIGCPIAYARPSASSQRVTYHRDVLPIIQKHCQSCHRPGELGPFSLMTYRQAVQWADDIKTYTQSRQMPPWTVTESVPFQNERRLAETEIAALSTWVDSGMPEGNAKDAPPPVKFAEGWQLGEPDLVLEPKGDMTLAAQGPDLFRCFVLPTRLPEHKYVNAYEIRPGNRKVVHHILSFLDTKKRGQKLEKQAQESAAAKDQKDFGPGYTSMMGPGFFPPSGDMGGWAPGMGPHRFPKDVGSLLPRDSDVVMQVHYHRTGRVEKDRTRMGLYFAQGPGKAIQGLIVPGWITWIPAGAGRHPVQGSIWVAQDCTIYNVTPHMHLLGKSIKVTMTPPDGKPVTLIQIKEWDYNWQETYFFKQPIHVKAQTRFSVEAIYDNSSGNRSNPFNPPRIVFPGEQTTNEMCFAFLDTVTDDGKTLGVRLSSGGFVFHRPGSLPRLP